MKDNGDRGKPSKKLRHIEQFNMMGFDQKRELHLIGFSVKRQGSNWLVTIRAVIQREPYVTWQSFRNIADIVSVVENVLQDGEKKWKMDDYY